MPLRNALECAGMLVLSDDELVVARRCGMLRDASVVVLRRQECIMRGMERRRESY